MWKKRYICLVLSVWIALVPVVEVRAETGESAPVSEIPNGWTQAVFRVEAGREAGLGSLVDHSGLIVTAQEVVAASEFIRVTLPSGESYRAQVVDENVTTGTAIIRVHPEVVASIPPLVLREISRSSKSLLKGDEVWVVLKPTNEQGRMMSARVKKVSGASRICYDMAIPEDTRGGPLLSSKGEVIGINTSRPRQAAAGTSKGSVPLNPLVPRRRNKTCAHSTARALRTLNETRERVAKTEPPSPDSLNKPSESVYPERIAREAAATIPNSSLYRQRAGKVNLEILTPPLVQHLAKQSDSVYEPDRDFFPLAHYLTQNEPVVILRAIPDLRVTAGSGWRVAGYVVGEVVLVTLATLATFGAILEEGEAAGEILFFPPPTAAYRFKRDLNSMSLLRDGKKVPPVRSELVCETRKMLVSKKPNKKPKVRTIRGCYGVQFYAPEVFQPGSNLSVRIYEGKKPAKGGDVQINTELVNRVWSDFQPYFEALAAGQEKNNVRLATGRENTRKE